MFSRDVTAFKIFPRKLPPPYWCPFKARVSCDLQKMSLEDDKAPKLSEYTNALDPPVKKRYMQKIACIGVDPFLISGKNYDVECLPSIESIDFVSYLVLETSYYTKEQFKAFKSLQAVGLWICTECSRTHNCW